MPTAAARRSQPQPGSRLVCARAELLAAGVTRHRIGAQLEARRWQLFGRAVVLHNGGLIRLQTWQVARLNCGPRAVLAAFTAAELHGLRGWPDEPTHVLGPAGSRRPQLPELRIWLHRTGHWQLPSGARVQPLPAALVLAASTFDSARPACGIVAAAVQQGLTTPEALHRELSATPRTRHRAALVAAVADIAGGSQALSEIDFVRLCRRAGLPLPGRQSIRLDRHGHRRYLDATWRRADGRLVVVEIDGALHLGVSQWMADQDRQNELVIDGAIVLRFPSIMVRAQPELVADQLRRILSATR